MVMGMVRGQDRIQGGVEGKGLAFRVEEGTRIPWETLNPKP